MAALLPAMPAQAQAGSADMEVTSQPISGAPGQTVRAKVGMHNLGPDGFLEPTLSITAQGPITFQSVELVGMTGEAFTCSVQLYFIQCDTPPGYSWPADGTGYVIVTGTLSGSSGQSGQICGNAIDSHQQDTYNPNNYSCADVVVTDKVADLAVVTTDDQHSYRTPTTAGATVDLPFKVVNNGPDAAGVPQVNFFPPEGYTITAITPPAGWTCDQELYSCTGSPGSLAAGDTAEFTVTGTVPDNAQPGDEFPVRAEVSVGGDSADTNPDNDVAVNTLYISDEEPPVIAVDKRAPATVEPGADLTYTVTVSNDGAGDAPGVSFTDTVPASLSGVTWTCGEETGGAACSEPSGSGNDIATAVDLPAGSSVTFTITGTVADDAGGTTITNTAKATDRDGATAEDSADTDVPVANDIALTGFTEEITPGESIRVTATVTNNGPSDLAGVATVTLPAPNGITYSDPPDGCALQDDGSLQCVIPAALLPEGGSVELTWTATADPGLGAGTRGEDGDVVASDDPDESNNADRLEFIVEAPSADLSIDKRPASTDPVAPGETFEYVLAVANGGPSTATDVAVTDTLPEQLSFVSSGDGCTAAGQDVTCPALATLEPGGSASFTITVKLDPAYTGDGSDIVNTGTVAGSTDDPDESNNTDTDSPSVGDPEADLALDKAALYTSPLTPGGTVTYQIRVTNNGPSAAQGYTVTDQLPDGVAFVSSISGCAASGRTVTCDSADTLEPGDSVLLRYRAQVDPAYTGDGSDLVNNAAVTSTTDDPDESNNSDGTDLDVGSPEADVAIAKTGPSTPVSPGDTFDYRVTVTNNGPSDAEGVTVTDTLPAETAFQSGDGCTESGGTVTCGPIDTLAPGETRTYTITVRLDSGYVGDGSDLANRAHAEAATDDPDLSNNDVEIAGPVVGPATADLAVTKEVEGDPVISPGETYTYKVTAVNNGPSTAINPQAVDTVDDDLEIVDHPDYCRVSGQVITCKPPPTGGKVLEPGETVEATITVRLKSSYTGDGSDLTNAVTVSADTADPDESNNTATVTGDVTVEDPEADLAITKAVSPDEPVVPGTAFTYTFTVVNDGPSDAADATVTDTLPEGVVYRGSVDGECSAGPGGREVTCSSGALAAGDSHTFTVTVLLSPDYTGDGSDLPNTATVSSTTDDPDESNNTSTAVTPTIADPVSDVSVRKRIGDRREVRPGTEFTYHLFVANDGPSSTTGFTLVDTLPDAVSFVSATDPSCTASGQTVTCDLGDFPVGAKRIGITVRLDDQYTGDGSDLVNTVVVSSDNDDPDESNNTDDATGPDVLEPEADLEMSKEIREASAAPGETFTYTLKVTNHGPSAAVDTTAVDTLPDRAEFVSSPDCTASGQTVTCGPEAVLEPGSEARYEITVRLDPAYRGDGTDLVNTATASSSTDDPDESNDTDTATGPSIDEPRADVAIEKTGPATAVAGENVEYTLTVVNHGPSTATDVTIIDALPENTELAGSDADCTATAERVVRCDIGDLAVGETKTVTLTVNVHGTVPDGVALRNTSAVTAAEDDPDPANNESDTVVEVASNADLAVSKRARPQPVRPGDEFEYVVTVVNNGPSSAMSVEVTDELPDVVEFVSSASGCTADGRAVMCPEIASLDEGESREYVLTVRLDENYTGDGSDILNTATGTTHSQDPDESNNSDTIDLAVTPPPSPSPSPTEPVDPTEPPSPEPTDTPEPGPLPVSGTDLAGVLGAALLSLALGAVLLGAARLAAKRRTD